MNQLADFELDARLARDGHFLTELPLCRLLLMNDSRWPWLVLVPRRTGLRDLVDLDPLDRVQMFTELDHAARWVRANPLIEKLNIASLGNVVPQLHVHLIGRHAADPAWPKPVWGVTGEPVPYPESMVERVRTHFATAL